ncbi:MAG: hypothetical protein MZV64_43600 [Ignavibacteriales bacterium]|nr:hypothetical protein [Ignavibacteriales bacterium]
MHNGSPALFLDGRPVFAAINWVSGPAPDRWDFEGQARQERRGRDPRLRLRCRQGDRVGRTRSGTTGEYDFTTVEARFRRVLEADPAALFHLRVYLEPGHGDWWEKAHTGECELLSDGRRNGMSFASRVWRDEAKAFLRAYIAHFRQDRALRPGHRLPGRGRPHRRMGQRRVVHVCPLRRLQRAHARLFPGLAEGALSGRDRPSPGGLAARPGRDIRDGGRPLGGTPARGPVVHVPRSRGRAGRHRLFLGPGRPLRRRGRRSLPGG